MQDNILDDFLTINEYRVITSNTSNFKDKRFLREQSHNELHNLNLAPIYRLVSFKAFSLSLPEIVTCHSFLLFSHSYK